MAKVLLCAPQRSQLRTELLGIFSINLPTKVLQTCIPNGDNLFKEIIFSNVLRDSDQSEILCQSSPTCLPVSLRLGSVMVLLTPGPQMLLAACARHTDNFLQECVHLKTIEKVNYCKWIFCLSSCCNPPSVSTLPLLFFSQLNELCATS